MTELEMMSLGRRMAPKGLWGALERDATMEAVAERAAGGFRVDGITLKASQGGTVLTSRDRLRFWLPSKEHGRVVRNGVAPGFDR